MFHLASRILFLLALFRMGALAGSGIAVLFGIYVLATGSIVSGLFWIVGGAAAGWVLNLMFGLLHTLGSAAVSEPFRK